MNNKKKHRTLYIVVGVFLTLMLANWGIELSGVKGSRRYEEKQRELAKADSLRLDSIAQLTKATVDTIVQINYTDWTLGSPIIHYNPPKKTEEKSKEKFIMIPLNGHGLKRSPMRWDNEADLKYTSEAFLCINKDKVVLNFLDERLKYFIGRAAITYEDANGSKHKLSGVQHPDSYGLILPNPEALIEDLKHLEHIKLSLGFTAGAPVVDMTYEVNSDTTQFNRILQLI